MSPGGPGTTGGPSVGDAEEAGPFRRRTLAALATVGGTGLALMLLYMTFGPRSVGDAGAAALARSAVGYRALAQLLATEVEVKPARGVVPIAATTYTPILLVDPSPGRLEALRETVSRAVAEEVPVVVVLPKWTALPDPLRPGWASTVELRSPERVAAVLAAALGNDPEGTADEATDDPGGEGGEDERVAEERSADLPRLEVVRPESVGLFTSLLGQTLEEETEAEAAEEEAATEGDVAAEEDVAAEGEMAAEGESATDDEAAAEEAVAAADEAASLEGTASGQAAVATANEPPAEPVPLALDLDLPRPQLFLDRLGYFEPTVAAPEGILVGRARDLPVWVVADPDLLNVAGLGRGDNALLVHRLLVGEFWPDAFYVRAETFGALPPESSVWSGLLRPPLSTVALHLALVALLVSWVAAERFGRPRVPPPRVPPGKRTLVDNTARLLEAAGDPQEALLRYLDLTTRRAAERLGLPAGLPESERLHRLDRIGERRGASSRLRDHVVAARSLPAKGSVRRRRAVQVAEDLHRWYREACARAAAPESRP